MKHLEGAVNVADQGGRPAGAPTPPSDSEDVPQSQSTIFISGEDLST